MTVIPGEFDVQIDSNHRWGEDQIMEIDAYQLIRKEDGNTETDTLTTVASVRIPADVCTDMWIASTNSDEIAELSPLIRSAYNAVVSLATEVQKEMFSQSR
jgi:hypothetical protein